MASFMDYYEDELRKRGSSSAPTSSGTSARASDVIGGAGGPAESGPQSPVNWAMDMLSRSTYGMTNARREDTDRMVSGVKKFSQGDVIGGVADFVSGIPTMPSFLGPGVSPALELFKTTAGNNTNAKYLEGLTSNDPAMKQSNEGLLEYTVDKAGTELAPNSYRDTDDNLAPGFKGLVGFGLDVATDPLTYVSGTGLLAGAKGLAKAADKGLSAVSEGLVGADKVAGASTLASRAAGKAAREAAEGAVKGGKGKKGLLDDEGNPFEDYISDPGSFRPSRSADTGKVETLTTYGSDLERVSDILRGSVPTPGRPAGVPERLALEAPEGAVPAAARATSEAASPIDELLAGMKSPEGPAAPAAAAPQAPLADDVLGGGTAPVAAERSVEDIINASPNRQPIADTLTRLADDLDAARTSKPFNAEEFVKSSKTKRYIPLPGSTPRSYTLLDLAKIASTEPRTPRGQMATKIVVSAVGDAKKLSGQQASATDILSVFSRARALDEQSLRGALGDDLYDYLGKINSPAKLQRDLANIRRVIEPDESVQDVLRIMDQNIARALTHRLGVPRAAKAKTPEEAAALADRLLSKNEPYQHALAKGLAKALDAELVDLAKKGYAYYVRKLGMKVARTSRKPGAGKGRYVDQLNGFSQYTMLRSQTEAIDLAALDIMRAQGIKGQSISDLYSAQRTSVYKEAALRVMDDQAKLLDDIGAHMSIGVGADTAQLSMAEVYRGLLSAAKDLGTSKTIDQGLFNYGTQAAPTAVTDAVAKAIAGGSREDVLAILLDPKKYGNKGLLPGKTGSRPNNLIDSGHGWGFLNRKSAASVLSELGLPNSAVKNMIRVKKAGEVSKTTGRTRGANHYWISYKSGGQNYMAEALADTIMQAKGSLGLRAADNEMAFVARTRQEVHKLSSDELAKIEAFLKDPSGTIAKTRMFKASNTRIEADAAKINASPDAVDASESVVSAALGEDLMSVVSAAGKADPMYTSAETALDLRRANETFTDGTWGGVKEDFKARPMEEDLVDPATGLRQGEEWAEVVDEATPLHGDWRDMMYDEAMEYISKKGGSGKKVRKGKAVDLSQDAPAMIDAFGNKIIDPYGIMKNKISEWFNQNYLAQRAMPLAHAWQNSMSMRTAYVGHQLNAISKAAKRLSPDQDLLPNAFASIQKGLKSTDPKMAELEDMITGVLGDFFELDNAGSLGNVFLRTTSQPDLINAMLKQKGIDEMFDIGLARKTAAETGTPLDKAISEQWRDWKINDPLEFMHKMSQARQELAFNKGTAMSFMEMAKDLGAVSNKKAAGYVRIQASGESRFAAHLPDNVFIKKELADELQRVEQVYRTSREFSGQLGDFVRNTYAPLLNAWKFAITLPRPGHHIRNLIGDTSVTWMRRGNRHFGQSWKDAVKLLSTRNNYSDVNMLEAATRYGIKDLPKGGDTIFRTEKFGDFTADELYAALAEGGALPTYQIGEDFVNAGGKLNNFLGKATLRDTKVGEGLGKLSEGRDHLARFQHFIQILRQDSKGWKGSREDLIKEAVKEVTKYHPDASLLTTTESKLRLAIPFYSWFGKILPALTESLIMHPGRLSTFNKVSYNWAVANGLDPESLSDPFPDDQLFPSFLTEQALGPQFTAGMLPGADGQYIRMNPGIAHLDVMNTLGPDPLRGIAGMVSPLIRVPAELLSGGSWGTGAPIRDWSDYLDQSIPGINYAANISGFSPTGSVESLIKGEGLDQQRQVETGNKGDFDKALSVANWITGLGIQNLSRPNYINYAEIEKRNRASEK